MTRRKSGLPSDDSNACGITSLCNSSDNASDMRERALQIEKSIKLAQRYETVTLTDLAAWPSCFKYSTLSSSLKEHVRDYNMWQQLRNTTSSRQQPAYDQLDDSVYDQLAQELCNIHTIILYTLHTQVLPEYIAFHTLGGEQTLHWESLLPDSDQHRKRQLVLDRMNSIQAPGTKGKLLDYYGWTKAANDIGMLHLLHRDLPDTKYNQKVEDDEDDDEIEAAHRTATRSKSTRSIASGFVRAMYTAVIVLGREAHPRSIVAPVTSVEWRTLVNGFHIPEDMLQGCLVTPKFRYSDYDVDSGTRCHQVDFLTYRTAGPVYKNIFIGEAYFAVRAMNLAQRSSPNASVAKLHKDCRRIAMATANSSKACFDHCITVANSMLQRSDDIYEPDTLDSIAIKAYWPQADITGNAEGDRGHLLSGVVRRQLALYHRAMVDNARNRKNTIAIAGQLDRGGLMRKQAGGRLPENLSSITAMRTQLWRQVWSPLWEKIAEWLQSQDFKPVLQTYLGLTSKHFDALAKTLREEGLVDNDFTNLRIVLSLELAFLRSQVWREALCKEFSITEHKGKKLYVLNLTRSFKRACSTSQGSQPSATQWPLSQGQSAVVHTLLHLEKPSEKLFPKFTQQAASKVFGRLGWNFCGVPRLGSHALRTYHTCEAVNRPDVTPADYSALASHMQVSVDTMNAVYAAPSLHGPVAQLAFKLHDRKADTATAGDGDEQQQKKQKIALVKAIKPEKVVDTSNQQMLGQMQQLMQMQMQMREQHEQQMLLIQKNLNCKPESVAEEATVSEPLANQVVIPYGRALNTERLKHRERMRSYFIAQGFCSEDLPPPAAFIKDTFKKLCDMRSSKGLTQEAAWFAEDVTFFKDENELPFKNFIKKLWT